MFLLDSKSDCTDLEKALQFRYLHRNAFETPSAREYLQQMGLEKWRSNSVSHDALLYGKIYCDPIAQAYLPSVSVSWIHDDVGYGLYAEQAIEKDSYLGEYTGIVRKNDRRYLEPLNNYCYEYPIQDEIGRNYVIDATSGNATRFINHSSSPNLKPVYAFIDGFYHLIFLALDRIERGTQLSYDYGTNYWYLRNPPLSIGES